MTDCLILSIFPGIDLLGMAFEEEGFCVVRGPDLIFGGDIRRFDPPAHVFEGVIGGPPCQDFSTLRRSPPSGYGLEMLREFKRVTDQALPAWWLMENVRSVPDMRISVYSWQRIDLRASECGSKQDRLRHFQFGARDGSLINPLRSVTSHVTEAAALATEGSRVTRRRWFDFVQLQGLPADFDLPDFHRRGKYKAIGNGVPLEMGRVIARAVIDREIPADVGSRCICGCGRIVKGRAKQATAACRKRMQVRRERAALAVNDPGRITLDASQFQMVDA